MTDELNTIARGALLHDIGKVVQRASDNPTSKKHTDWGYEWLKANFDRDDPAINGALAHHYTKEDDYAFTSNMGLIWYESDNLASAERKATESLEEGKWHGEVALASPFSRIRNPNVLNQSAPLRYLPLSSQPGQMIPTAMTEEPVVTRENYRLLLNGFLEDLRGPAVVKPYSLDLLLMLFEKFFSGVPSITMKIYGGMRKEEVASKHPDISLYDHAKLAAAVAGCMYHYYSQTYPDQWGRNELLKDKILRVDRATKPYLLIGGDISGVQNFIYTITSKGALKSLKGRSFFLELLTEHAITEIIEQLALTRCNIIFSGGGHFYILGHNTEQSRKALSEIKKGMDSHLFEEFDGKLQLHIECAEMHPNDFSDASTVWREQTRKMEASKRRKWSDRLDDFLRPTMPHPECLETSCKICFREDQPLTGLGPAEEEPLQVCPSCKAQFELGDALIDVSRAKYPVIYRYAEPPRGEALRIRDTYYQLKSGWDRGSETDAVCVYRINDTEARHYSHPKSICLQLPLYQHPELRELGDAASAYGAERIGVLRLDVDNLGKIFSQAISQEDRTFSRLASISRGLNSFFKSYLNIVASGRAPASPTDVAGRGMSDTGRMISIVYAGGDDLFMIGNWLDITEAAFDVNQCFHSYTGNDFVTLSGGIAVNHEHYPVYRYAKAAERAETKAKQANPSKDAITLFGDRCFTWDDAGKIVERVRFFCRFLNRRGGHLAIDESKLSKSFFYRLLALSRRFDREGVLMLPKAAYLISRIKGRGTDPGDMLRLKEVVMNNGKKEWAVTEVATMWTLMLMRGGGGDNG